LASGIDQFVKLPVPCDMDDVELDEAQVKRVWIDPEFAKKHNLQKKSWRAALRVWLAVVCQCGRDYTLQPARRTHWQQVGGERTTLRSPRNGAGSRALRAGLP